MMTPRTYFVSSVLASCRSAPSPSLGRSFSRSSSRGAYQPYVYAADLPKATSSTAAIQSLLESRGLSVVSARLLGVEGSRKPKAALLQVVANDENECSDVTRALEDLKSEVGAASRSEDVGSPLFSMYLPEETEVSGLYRPHPENLTILNLPDYIYDYQSFAQLLEYKFGVEPGLINFHKDIRVGVYQPKSDDDRAKVLAYSGKRLYGNELVIVPSLITSKEQISAYEKTKQSRIKEAEAQPRYYTM